MINSNINSQKGNVLFLILIAVALFAALSYAVTQSSRSGGGDASKEKELLDYSSLQNYISGLRGAITRMTINGTAISEINFRPPSSFSSMTNAELAANVFSPLGGGISYDNSFGGEFVFSMQITDIGTTSSNSSGNEIVYLKEIPVNDDFCNMVNKKNSISGVPTYSQMDNVSRGGNSISGFGGIPAEMSSIPGKAEGCFEDDTNNFWFYYAVVGEQ